MENENKLSRKQKKAKKEHLLFAISTLIMEH